jgi:hypothetical protein
MIRSSWLKRAGKHLLVSIVVLLVTPLLIIWVLLPVLEAPKLAAPVTGDTVISNVTILNPGARRISGQSIILRNGRIANIRPYRATDPQPICSGCIAMPGLIDSHVHTPSRLAMGNQRLFALLYLRYGVTSVRDLGQSDGSVANWAAQLNSGAEAGPHVYRCGAILDGPPPGWPSAITVATPQEGRAAVARLAEEGVDCIKTYNHVDPATFAAISHAAREENLPHVGHVPHLVGLAAMASGFQAQHLTGFPYLRRKPPWDNDIAMADLAAMTDNEVGEAIDIARARQINLTPTLANARLRLTATDPIRFPPPSGADHLPDGWSKIWMTLVPHPANVPEQIDLQIAGAKRSGAIVALAKASNVDVLAGSDTLMPWVVPGQSLHHEINALAVAFGDNEAALAAATKVNGKYVGRGEIGVLAQGKRADILLLREDPVDDLTALDGWKILFVAGRRYDRHQIDSWLQQYSEHFKSLIYNVFFEIAIDLNSLLYSSNLRSK